MQVRTEVVFSSCVLAARWGVCRGNAPCEGQDGISGEIWILYQFHTLSTIVAVPDDQQKRPPHETLEEGTSARNRVVFSRNNPPKPLAFLKAPR